MSVASNDAFGQSTAKEIPHDAVTFENLGLLEQRDFLALVQELYVFDSASDTEGVFGRQSELLNEIDRAILLDDEDFANSLVDSLLVQIQPTADRRFQFRKLLGEFPSLLSDYYSQALKSLPVDQDKSFENVMRRLSLELDQKKFLARWPSVAEHTPYPGLRGYALRAYRDLMPVERRAALSDSVIEKLNANESLSIDEFLSLMGKTIPSDDDQESYDYYLSFGWIPYSKSFDSEVFLKKLSAKVEPHTATRIQKIGERLHDAQLVTTVPENIISDDLLIGSHWVLKKYSSSAPNLERALRDVDQELKPYRRFQHEIDTIVVDLADAEASLNFRRALEAVERRGWSFKSIPDFTYYALDENLRRVFAARIFPDLSIREGMAILEKRIFDLSESERLSILNSAFPRVDEASLAYDEMNRLPLAEASTAMNDFLQKLVHAYLIRDLEEPAPQEFKLLNGKMSVPRIEPLRDEMKLMIEQNRDSIDSGIFPRWFIEDLMVKFYPTDDHIEQEYKRFSNEWARRSHLDRGLKKIGEIKKQMLKAKGTSEEERLAQELASVVSALNAELMVSPIDIDSDFTMLAAFLYGVTPHDGDDWREVAKSAGTGIVFVTILRFAGIKRLGSFIFTDTGLHYLTGYSTWIGSWTAQGIEETLSRLVRLQNPSSAEDRMAAAEELGMMTRDAIAFGIGGEIVRFSSSAVRLRARRHYRAIAREMEALKSSIASHKARLQSIREGLPKIQKELATLEAAGQKASATAEKLRAEIIKSEFEIAVLEGKGTQADQGRLGFYANAVYGAGLRFIDFWIPGRSKPFGVPQESIWKSFDRRRSLGIRQFELSMRELEIKSAAVDRRVFLWEQFPYRLTAPKNYIRRRQLKKAMVRYSEAQDLISKRFLESDSLIAANEFKAASQSLEAAAKEMLTHSNELRNLVTQLTSKRPSNAVERGFFKLDDIIQNDIRPVSTRRRPVQSTPVEPGQANERLVDTLRLNGRDQLNALEESIQRIRNSITLFDDNLRLSVEPSLRNAESSIAASRRSFDQARFTN